VLIFAVYSRAMVLLEVQWVILELFPPVAALAVEAVRASIAIVNDFFLSVPLSALLVFVRIQIWFAPVILPVVGIDARLPIVVLLLVGAPLRFEVKSVEVRVTVEPLDQINRDFSLVVRESAVITVFARSRRVRITLAKLRLVHFGVIKFFDRVVGQVTSVAHRAQFFLRPVQLLAKVASVGAQLATTIFGLVVVIRAAFWVVVLAQFERAFLCFEDRQVEKECLIALI